MKFNWQALDAQSVVNHWSARLTQFIPGLLKESTGLDFSAGQCAIILHGSTTLGIDDASSDLDIWVLTTSQKLSQAKALAGKQFFNFALDGKPGHFNLEDAGKFATRVRTCDLERIAELRVCHVLEDVDGMANDLIHRARQPMREQVRQVWFCRHYVEMRGFHRNCDNPIDRGDSLAILQGLVPTLNHALRAAMVLDSEPYPYIKWLGLAARQTPTGQKIVLLVNEILDALGTNALRQPGPERSHPVGNKLREIRLVLDESARAGGIDGPWISRWWEHMDNAKAAIEQTEW